MMRCLQCGSDECTSGACDYGLEITARWITDQPEPKLEKGPPVKMGIWSGQGNMLTPHGQFTDTLQIPANCVERKLLRNLVRPGDSNSRPSGS